VALEKGYLFLRAIAESAGAERFAGFLRDLAAFRFCSVTGEEVVAFARKRLPDAVDYDEWLHGTGLPAATPTVSSSLLDAVNAIGQAAPEPDVAAAWSADEWQVYLARLQPPVPAELLAELDSRYHLTTSTNPEILRLWLTAALCSGYLAAVPAAVDLLGRVGRLKFLRPLYDALARNPDACVLARECFERNRSRYHPIAVTVIGTRLSQAPCGS
jgi:leukotriene-A4 hydrolase